MTCAIGRFEIPGMQSLGEALAARAQGGAVAVWAPGGMAFNRYSALLDAALFEALYVRGRVRLGDAILETLERHAQSGRAPLLPCRYNLLGDPATAMAEPRGALIEEPPVTVDQWKQEVFTPEELADPEISGDGADPEGDGISNLAEYAFNLDPGRRDPAVLLRPAVVRYDAGGDALRAFFVARFVRRRQAPDIRYEVDAAGDLLEPEWRGEPEGVEVIGRRLLDGIMEQVIVRVKVPPYTEPQAFVRLRVVRDRMQK
jgi:hypothetical protein